jgi:hypothetical protein
MKWEVFSLQSNKSFLATIHLFEVSTFTDFCSKHLSQYSESNGHVYVQEDGYWTIRGRFAQAMLDDEPVEWVKSADGKLSLPLACVSIVFVLFIVFTH